MIWGPSPIPQALSERGGHARGDCTHTGVAISDGYQHKHDTLHCTTEMT